MHSITTSLAFLSPAIYRDGIYTTNNEQGYAVKKSKDPTREVVNFDGIYLSAHIIKKNKNDNLQ